MQLLIDLNEMINASKCPCSEFFWSSFSRIWTGSREIRSISPCSVQIRKLRTRKTSNTDTSHRGWCSALSGGNILIKKVNYKVEEGRSFKKTRKLLEKSGYQGFCKLQLAMSRIMATKKKKWREGKFTQI